MIIVAPVGNVRRNKRLAAKFKQRMASGECEIMYLSRHELEKFRIRRKTDKGTDVCFIRGEEGQLRNGDVLVDSEKQFVVVEQLSEPVISVKIKPGTDRAKAFKVAALLAHGIGNRHRPIAVKGSAISFPAAESELEVFERLARPLQRYVQLTTGRGRFEPDNLGEVHEHPA